MKEPIDLVDRWSRWVDELTSYPLDRFEYEGMLECRDRIAETLWRLRSEEPRLDEVDARFKDLTINEDGTGVRSSNQAWLRDRLPGMNDGVST
jgi:hypothetical protein